MDFGNQWQLSSQRTAQRIQFGAVIQTSIPSVLLVGLVSLCLGVAGRLNGWANTWVLPVGVVSSIVPVLGIALIVALRKNGEMDGVGLTRLDMTRNLHNALTSAAAGRGKWPVFTSRPDDMFRFNWGRILIPYVYCVVLALAGMFVPLPLEAVGAGKIPPPRAHEEMAALIAELKGVEALKKEDMEQLQKQLDEIREEPAENWYHHSSLEAADHLQSSIREQIEALENSLNKAASALAALESVDEATGSIEQQRAAGEFKAALQELKMASPGLNQKLMESLSAIDPGNLKSLASGELESMIEQMKTAAGACKNCQGRGRGGKSGENGEARGELEELLGSDDGLGHPKGSGRGSIERGPGVAPLPFSRNPSELGTDKPESLQTEDFRRARPGDTIGTAEAEHKLAKAPVSPQSGGSAAAGKGGEAVSRDTLVPSEKAVLKAYFR